MADREPPDPRSRRTGPRAHPPTAAGGPGRTVDENPGGEGDSYEILTPPDAPTTPDDDALPWSPPAEVPQALAGHPRYRVLRKLGSGGMGTVYLAEHRLMGRQVALKVINRDLTEHASLRFEREVRAAATLHHPNIVTAFDAEQAGPLHFLVMEYVEGTDLGRLVKRKGPLPPGLACDIARQVASGLQHAHEHGMVHRDIKPQNLMRTRHGQVKILDFGLALFASEVGEDGGFTGSGAMLGTADYIAPEQADDAHMADIRADIYSLGCTLYCLLAGHPPFPGGTLMQKLASHSRRSPKGLGEIRADLPRGLDRVIKRMMDKDPKHRYQTPAEVAEALAPFADPEATDATTGPTGTVVLRGPKRPASSGLLGPGDAGPRRRPPAWAIVALVVVLGLTALSATRNWKPRRAPIVAAVPSTDEVLVGRDLVVPAPPTQEPAVPPPPESVPPPPKPDAAPPPKPDVALPPMPDAAPRSESATRSVPPPVVPVTPARSAEEILKGKGLLRFDRVYRLEDEARIQGQSQLLQNLRADLEDLWGRWNAFGPQIEQLTFEYSQLITIQRPRPGTRRIPTGKESKQERDRLDEENRLAESSYLLELDNYQRAMDRAGVIHGRINALTMERQLIASTVQSRWIDLQSREIAFLQQYNALGRRYDELRRDSEVSWALNELNKTAQPNVVLGPVENYSEYRKKVLGSANQRLMFKGLVYDKGGRYLLASELMAKTQATTLLRAREKMAKAQPSTRKAAEDLQNFEKDRKKVADELAKLNGVALKAAHARLNFLDGRIKQAKEGPAPMPPDAPGSGPRGELLRAVVELRNTAEAVRAQREARLAEDPEVKAAFLEVNKERKSTERARIAEVTEATKALELLDAVQAEIGLREFPVRDEAGASLVDAALNGGPAFAVVIDPKSAGLRLSAALAARVGVAPRPDAAPAPIRLADGQSASAREAPGLTLDFGTVKLVDVPCLVLPPEVGDPPPTLGTQALGASAAYLDTKRAKFYVATFAASPGPPAAVAPSLAPASATPGPAP